MSDLELVVGKKVWVNYGLTVGFVGSSNLYVNNEMVAMCGKRVKIASIVETPEGQEPLYTLAGDPNSWNWSGSLFTGTKPVKPVPPPPPPEILEVAIDSNGFPIFEIGDYVRIRPNLRQQDFNDPTNTGGWVDSMSNFSGMIAKITSVHTNGRGQPLVKIDIDMDNYYWDPRSFETTKVSSKVVDKAKKFLSKFSTSDRGLGTYRVSGLKHNGTEFPTSLFRIRAVGTSLRFYRSCVLSSSSSTTVSVFEVLKENPEIKIVCVEKPTA